MQKIILILIFTTLQLAVFGQDLAVDSTSAVADSLLVGSDSTMVTVDSLDIKRKPKSIVDTPIEYECKDSMLISFDDKRVFLYGTADVKTSGMELNSEYMRMEMESSSIYAEGRMDSAKNELVGTPVFKDGSDEFEARVIKYNFKTKEGFVNDVQTQQQNGYLFGEITKMHANKEIHLKNGRYTTCDLDHPHFYLELTRAKVIPNDKIITGPCYFVLLDIPVYVLGLPFGIFPSSRKKQNGIIIPSYGEESRRGFYLRDGGYYMSFGDYADLELLGSYYTYGSWGLNANSKFKLRYKFSGNMNFMYSKNVQGRVGFEPSTNPDIHPSESSSYKIGLNFTLDPKANPSISNLSAHIDYDRQNYDMQNATNLDMVHKASSTSSVNFSKSLWGGFGSLSASANLTQNLYDTTFSLHAPDITFTLNKFFPLRRKNRVGPARWYENIGTGLTVNFKNEVPTLKEEYLFKQEMYDTMKYGLQYSLSPSTSLTLLKYLKLTPSVQIRGVVLPTYVERYIDDNRIEEENYKYSQRTVNEIKHAIQYTTGLGMTTTLYGMYEFEKAKRIKAIRHVLTPSLSMSYNPDFTSDKFSYYSDSPISPGNKSDRYNKLTGGVFSGPSSKESASASLSFTNNIEMKVKGKNDTIQGQYTKIKIVDFNLGTAYNFAADEYNLSTINLNGSTKILGQNLTFDGRFDPYYFDSNGKKTPYYSINECGKLATFTNGSIRTSFGLDSKTLGKKKQEEKEKAAKEFAAEEAEAEVDDDGNIIATAEEVAEKKKNESKLSRKERDGEFDYYSCPWNASISYGLTYSNPNGMTPKFRQTFDFHGGIKFTDKWNVSFSASYDFDTKKFTNTSVSVTRDLHCFGLSFHIVPFGPYKNYNFNLAINSSMFSGLQFKRNQSWRDN